jgi:type IV secretion system protein VirB9
VSRLVSIALLVSVVALVPSVTAEGSPAQEFQSGSYKLSGAALIRPSVIWDDGAKTYVDWPEGVEAPAIFAVDGAGNESLVNSHYRDGKFVIDAIHSRLIFRLDALVARAERKAGRP